MPLGGVSMDLVHLNKGSFRVIDKYTVEHKGHKYTVVRVEPATGDVIAYGTGKICRSSNM